jgi:hypothetical protein
MVVIELLALFVRKVSVGKMTKQESPVCKFFKQHQNAMIILQKCIMDIGEN